MSEEREELKANRLAKETTSLDTKYPSNSKTKVIEKKEEKKVSKVTKGKVLKKKKSLGKRFMETFVGDDIKNVKSYILHDVLIPMTKDTIIDIAEGIGDAIKGTIEVSLFGERRSRSSNSRRRDSGNRSYISYDSISSRNNRGRDRDRDRTEASSRNRNKHNFDDIILSTRQEANDVLNNLVDLVIDYGEASVADLFDLVGIKEEHVDRKYGWRDLSSASVSRISEGYLLNLPKTVLLD